MRYLAAHSLVAPRNSAERKLQVERLEIRNLLTAVPGTADAASLLSAGGLCTCPICTGRGQPPATAQTSLTSAGPVASVPLLSSNPGATAKLYLDFDGDFQSSWGSRTNISTPAFDLDGDFSTFNASERTTIQETWARVAEDYAPFNIDVTTIAPGSLANRVVAHMAIGGNGSWYGSAGGVAYIGGFYNGASNVGYVFEDNLGNGQARYVAEAASHEAGHLFGLNHQSLYNGTTKTQEYYSGNAAWAPIMGAGFSSTRSTWHNGASSASSTALQDDIAVIANANNGFGLKADDFGSTITTASTLSVSGTSVNVAGLLGYHTDQDVWQFTTSGGSVSFSLNAAAYGPNLDAILEIRGSSGNLLSLSDPSDSLNASISTTLGSGTYYVIARSNGTYGNLGQYTLSGTVPAAVTAWGNIDFFLLQNRQATGDMSFSATATRTGWFSAEAFFAHSAGNVNLEVYDASQQLLGSSNSLNNAERVDVTVTAGQQLFIRIVGVNSNVTYRCVNLVSASGDTIHVAGTAGDDLLVMLPGSGTHRVAVNGVGYDFDANVYDKIVVQDTGGVDTLVFVGTEQDESAVVLPGSTAVTGAAYTLTVTSAEFVQLHAGGGSDSAIFHDRVGNDTYVGTPTEGTLSGAGYTFKANGFDQVSAVFAVGGFDQAFLYGSIGDDRYEARADKAFLQGPNFRHDASGYDTVVGVGGAGNDIALLFDTAGDEIYNGDPKAATLSSATLYLRAELFERVESRSTGGYDVAWLRDSPGNDALGASKILAWLNGVGFSNYVEGFDLVTAISLGGLDTADLYDSAGDDRLTINGGSRRLESTDYAIQIENFRTVRAYASVGNDTVTMQQLLNTDKITGRSNWATLANSNGRTHTATGFDAVTAVAKSTQKPQADVAAIDYLFSKIGW